MGADREWDVMWGRACGEKLGDRHLKGPDGRNSNTKVIEKLISNLKNLNTIFRE